MFFLSGEGLNYIKQAPSRTRSWLADGWFFSRLLAGKLYYRLRTDRQLRYPARARALSAMAQGPSAMAQGAALGLPFDFRFTTALLDVAASTGAAWASVCGQVQGDEELSFSLNRWYWLVYDQPTLKQLTAEQVHQLAAFWISNNPFDADSPVWEPYSTSERLASYAVALSVKCGLGATQACIAQDEHIRNFVLASRHHLLQRLEYYPGGVTFNHVVNDLKGLLIAAILLNDEPSARAVAALMDAELREITDRDGFLREGSSHYQLIITRWICECCFLLRQAGWEGIRAMLQDHQERLMAATRFFLNTDITGPIPMPLFGDISPDFDPSWLCRYFLSASTEAGGWHYSQQVFPERLNRFEWNGPSCSQFTEYSRLQGYGWLLFIRHAPAQPDYFPNHSHDDFGSFQLYYQGALVLGDAGRYNYVPHPTNTEQCSAPGHNGVTINSLLLALSNNYHLLPAAYRSYTVAVDSGVSQNSCFVSVALSGSRKMNGFALHRHIRTFRLSPGECSVKDSTEGKGTFTVTTNFVFPPGAQLTSTPGAGGYHLAQEAGAFGLTASGGATIMPIAYSTRYGSVADGQRLVCNQQGVDACSMHFSLAVVAGK